MTRLKYLLLILPIMSLGCSIYLPYHGKVMDAETHNPIKNAFIIRHWASCYLCLAGGYCDAAGEKDARTDVNGAFTVSGTVIPLPVPGIFSTGESIAAYKPGYRYLELTNKPRTIFLTKVPTDLELRKKEAEKAGKHALTHDLGAVLLREEEFVNIRGYNYSRTYNKCRNIDHRSMIAKQRGFGNIIFTCSNTQNLSHSFVCKDKSVLFSSKEDNVNSVLSRLNINDWRARKNAAWKLGNIDDPRAVDLLVGMLGDSNKEVVKSATAALGMHLEPGALDPLIALLDAPDRDVVGVAAQTLGKYNDPKAVSSLRALLNDKREGIRLAAVSALGNMCDRDAFDVLIDQLEKDDSSQVRAAIVMLIPSVNGMYNAHAARALIGEWNEEDGGIRARATDTLEQMGDCAVDPLIEATSHRDPYFRWKAARVLGKLNSTKAVPSLLTLLKDESPEVRWYSLQALGSLRDESAIGPITELLKDKDDGIVEKAKQTLKSLRQ